jgi:hypothetical protein
MTWRLLEEQAPDVASFGARRLTAIDVAYLATVDDTGRPRVHPVTPIVAPGSLFVFMEPASPKGRDLQRGSGFALHCSVEDSGGGAGEFLARGWARRIEDPETRAVAAAHAPYSPADRYVLFELELDEAITTVYPDGGRPVRQRWLRN